MSVDQVVELEVVVVFSKRVDQSLGDLHPPDIKRELEGQEKWEVKVQGLERRRLLRSILEKY